MFSIESQNSDAYSSSQSLEGPARGLELLDDSEDSQAEVNSCWSEIPLELIWQIFSYLPRGDDIVRCGLVCRNWRSAILAEEKFRLIRGLTYMNRLGVGILRHPLIFFQIPGVDLVNPHVSDFIRVIKKANKNSPPPSSLVFEVERLFNHSLRHCNSLQQAQKCVYFLTNMGFFSLAMKKVEIASQKSPDRHAREISCERIWLNFALTANREGYVQAVNHAASMIKEYFVDELSLKLAEAASARETELVRKEVDMALKQRNEILLRRYIPFLDSQSQQCCAYVELAKIYKSKGEEEKAKETLQKAVSISESFGLEQIIILRDLICECSSLEMEEVALLLAVVEVGIETSGRSLSSDEKIIFAEILVATNNVERAIEVCLDDRKIQVSLSTLLAKYGYLELGLERVRRYSSLIIQVSGLIEISKVLNEDDRKIPLLNEAELILSNENYSYQGFHMVRLLFEIAQEFRSLEQNSKVLSIINKIRDLMKSETPLRLRDKFEIFVEAGSKMAEFEYKEEANTIFNEAKLTLIALKLEPSVYQNHLWELAQKQLKVGLVEEGRKTLNKVFISRAKNNDKEGLFHATFEIGYFLLHAKG